MLKNYIKTAWRNFRKNGLLSAINVGGLSVGIAAVLLIGLYVYTETNYDSFHKNGASVYRVGFKFWQNGKSLGDGPYFTPPFAPDAQNEFPEINAFTRVSSERVSYITYNEKTVKVDNIHYADSSFFQLFSFNLNKGNPREVLKSPYSIVLTSQTAQRLFGTKEDPINKVVRLDNQTDFTVTGVAQVPRADSHLSFNGLLSFVTLYKEPGNFMDWNGGEQYAAYLQLKDEAKANLLQKKFPSLMWKHINKEYSNVGLKIDASLQPLRDIHLHYSDNSTSLRTNIYVFSIIALLILIISCVNYINLGTAQVMTRFKEIGVRKVLGARRPQVIKQFLTETTLLTAIAFLISILLVLSFSPVYEQVIGRNLLLLRWSNIPALLLLFGVVLVVGIVAGSYVAVYLSSFNATRIFKSMVPQNAQSILRKGLIVTQFSITTALMACTIIVGLQLKFSKNINPGFDKNHILVLPLIGQKTQEESPLLKQGLAQIPAVSNVTALSEIPYNGITNNGFIPEGDRKAMIFHELDADEDLLKTLKMNMVSGEFFAKERGTVNDGYVINEALAKILGWQNPLGKTIKRNGDHKIVGVIKDFHFASLHDKIEPLIITNKPWGNLYSFLALEYKGDNPSGLLNSISQTWKSTDADAPFDYWFLDDAFNTVYKNEGRFQQIFIYFSLLSIMLSLAGVFGLVALTLKQRTKELGIRKVLGAGITDTVKLAATDFVKLIVLAALVATPIAWYYMHEWLQNFAYRIHIKWWVFAICGLAVFIITISTISFQAIKAAFANPVKALRSE